MSITVEELEARLAELEARLGPVPLAVAPITIGEFTDVPTPGAPIASQWTQEVTRRTVHRFATTTARDAAYPAAGAGAGALCVTADTGTLWEVVFGIWAPISALPTTWVAATLTGGWAAFDGVHVPQYRRVGDDIQLRGLLKSGAVGTAAFTLPAGFRPAIEEAFAVVSNSLFGAVSVATAGTVTPIAPSSNAFVYLSGIRFSTLA